MVVKRFSCVGGEGGIIWRNCSFGIIRVRVVQRERERERETLGRFSGRMDKNEIKSSK